MCVVCEMGGRSFGLHLETESATSAPKPVDISAESAPRVFGVAAAIDPWAASQRDDGAIGKNAGTGGDTVPGNASTTFTLAIDGAAQTGYVNTSSDQDWYAVTLVAGQYYEFTLDPSGTLDAVLQLRNSAGAILASSDGPGAADTETIGFFAETSGTYYVVADGYLSTTGQYTLTGVTAPPPDILDSLDWGGQTIADPEVIYVYFAQAGEVWDGVSSLGWNSYEMQQAMAAFAQYENIINVDFQITTNSAIADFKLVTTTSSQYLGYCNPPGEPNAGVAVFARNGTGWDEAGGGGLVQGGYGFITMIHEFGHGMGLAHPHDNGGGSSVMLGVTGAFDSYGMFNLNQGVYTTMSYNDGWPTGPNGGSSSVQWGYQGTMMALDIAILQQKYGANTTFNSTATNYALDTANAVGTYYECIWDAGGVDQISYAGSASAFIDLRAATIDYSATGGGVVSYVTGIDGGFTIAQGVVIENASGGSGADTITGNSAANTLTGNGGNDVLNGGGGNDTFVFGTGHGSDTIHGFVAGGAEDSIQVSGYTGYWAVQEGADLRIVFDASNSILLTGVSAASFTASDINVGLNSGPPPGGGGPTPVTLTGTSGADTLAGGAAGDTLIGLGGNDVLNGLDGNDLLRGGDGNDTLNGGTGIDTADYSDATGGLKLSLASTGGQRSGGSGTETLSSIENITGGNFADQLTGSGGANVLNGGLGNDKLTGGAGADEFLFKGASFGSDTIADFTNGLDKIRLDGVTGVDDFSDLVITSGSGGSSIITMPDGSTITLTKFASSNLDASDFVFGP